MMSAPSDEQLLMQAGRGNREAFGQLAERYTDWLLQFSWRFLGHIDRHTAEDLTQDILLGAWRAAPRFTPRARVRTWLYRLAANRCLNHRRALQVRSAAAYSNRAEIACHDPDCQVDDSAQMVRAALSKLPDKQRATLILRHYHDLSYIEIAEILSTSVSAVESALFRARLALAERLRHLNIEERQQVSKTRRAQLPVRRNTR